jgi:RNA polymerase sigma-70 factor (ECF subfamily)
VIFVLTAPSSSLNSQTEIPLVDLLSLIADRASEPLQELYDRTAPQVYSMALTVVRDTHRAERITQQVYRDVWWRVAEFDAAAGSVESWLTLLTRARLIDDLRHSRLDRRARHAVRPQPSSAAEAWLHSIRTGADAIVGPFGVQGSAA